MLVKFLSSFISANDVLDRNNSAEDTLGEDIIPLSNGRSITVAGALACLITSSTVYFDIDNAVQLETISLAINLANLLLTSHAGHPHNVNMNVYESESNNYLGGYNTKIYCNVFEKLVSYLERQIYTIPEL